GQPGGPPKPCPPRSPPRPPPFPHAVVRARAFQGQRAALMPGNLKIAVLYEPSDNTGGTVADSERVHHKERRRSGRRRRWRGTERRYKLDRQYVVEALRANGHDASLYELSDEPSLLALSKTKADLIFNMAEAYAGDDSREAHVAAFLDLLELR